MGLGVRGWGGRLTMGEPEEALSTGSRGPSSTQAWPSPGAGDSGHQDNTGQCPEEGSCEGVGLEVMCKEVLRWGSWAAWPGTACHQLRQGL